jgi:hypothetical protein
MTTKTNNLPPGCSIREIDPAEPTPTNHVPGADDTDDQGRRGDSLEDYLRSIGY